MDMKGSPGVCRFWAATWYVVPGTTCRDATTNTELEENQEMVVMQVV
jgi:hypothetical protein